jgi:hypothetical protein
MRSITILLVTALLAGCATVRQSDLDAWVGVPVIALDTHSLLLGFPMVRTITDSGIEIRNYSERIGVSSCNGSGFVSANSSRGNTLSHANFNAYQSCISRVIGCDGIFYIREGKVIEAKVVGHCYTDESYRPEPGYEKFLNK